MTISRRAFAAAALAATALPRNAAARADGPLVIAHRGASGYRPEHTLAAYRLAIAQGADFIEPDLVATKDGVLVARHENEIGETTDVADRPEFGNRRTTRPVDGAAMTGWFVEDFTLAELKTLKARERLPQLRPASAAFDGQETVPTFQEIVELAAAESKARGRTIGLYPEMKHPRYFARIGLALEPLLARALKANGLDGRDAPVFVQCFEAEPLKTFRTLAACRTVFLVGGGSLPPETLAEIATYADGLGPELKLVLDLADGRLGGPTPLFADAHAAGLKVHPWTARAENHFLPKALQKGADPAAHGDMAALVRALFEAGADGVFTDHPDLAVAVRSGSAR